MKKEGLETEDPLSVDGDSPGYAEEAVKTGAESARSVVDASPIGPTIGPPGGVDGTIGPPGGVDGALARALEAAAAAGRFDVVAQLARELEARRLAESANVVALSAARPRTRAQAVSRARLR
jgi:hypothetical protein